MIFAQGGCMRLCQGQGFGSCCQVTLRVRGAAVGSSLVRTSVLLSSMAFRVVCARLAMLVLLASAAAVPRGSVAEVHVARSLAKTCGQPCETSLHDLLWEQASNGTSVPIGAEIGVRTLLSLASNAQRALGRAREVVGAPVASQGRLRGRAPAAVALQSVACASAKACALKAMASNKCNYARVALQSAYNELNVAVHALGVLVSSMCGCVHTGHVSSCALRSLPAVCTFPYTVYSKAFAGSVEVWEAVKASTKSCMVHGDPAVLR